MPELLIHSMAEFADIILGVLDHAGAQVIAEVGAEYGGMSSLLAEHVAGQGGALVSIDPAPKPEFLAWLETQPAVRHLAQDSLSAIPTLAGVDAWLIDGDHNWYTVYHELHAINALARRDGRPLLAFLHDIHWPVGRRDMYYAPDRIPEAYRHPHSYEGGTVPHEPFLRHERGFRGMGHFALALHEGGPRNGVLTAVEDFLAEELEAGRELAFCEVPGVFGLGIVFALDAPWSAAVADAVVPFHQNKLLASLEANRLANYLKVIDFQDRGAG